MDNKYIEKFRKLIDILNDYYHTEYNLIVDDSHSCFVINATVYIGNATHNAALRENIERVIRDIVDGNVCCSRSISHKIIKYVDELYASFIIDDMTIPSPKDFINEITTGYNEHLRLLQAFRCYPIDSNRNNYYYIYDPNRELIIINDNSDLIDGCEWCINGKPADIDDIVKLGHSYSDYLCMVETNYCEDVTAMRLIDRNKIIDDLIEFVKILNVSTIKIVIDKNMDDDELDFGMYIAINPIKYIEAYGECWMNCLAQHIVGKNYRYGFAIEDLIKNIYTTRSYVSLNLDDILEDSKYASNTIHMLARFISAVDKDIDGYVIANRIIKNLDLYVGDIRIDTDDVANLMDVWSKYIDDSKPISSRYTIECNDGKYTMHIYASNK